MKPVNLLPQRYSSAGPSGERSGVAYVALGVLGAVLLATLVYVVTANQATSREANAAEARSAADEAEARAAALAPFGAFQQIEQTRSAAVRALAVGRLDWERLARELAHVLPRNVRLESLEGSTGEGAASEASGTTTSTSSTATGTGETTGPSVVLSGCARSQPVVATMLVRLRRLNDAEDVTLEDSASAAGEGSPSGGDSSGGGSVAGCPAYSFNATVHLAPVAAAVEQPKAKAVPVRLGGGE